MKVKRFLIIALACIPAFLCGAQGFVIIEDKHPHELNPQITSYSSDAQILSGLYEGLFSYNPITLEPQFAIASDFKVSRDKKRWTINLRPEAKFSNGESITASSVRDSFIQLLSTPEAPYASLLDIIYNAYEYRNGLCEADDVGISVAEDYVLNIKLRAPANYLPKVLCHSSFSIIHRSPTVYSGAYMLEEKTEDSYVLKKNPYYWDAENVKLEEITFFQSDDEVENAFLFNTGKADWVTNNVKVDNVLNKTSIQVGGEFGTAYYFFKLSNRKPKAVGRADAGAGAADPAEPAFNIWDFPEFRNALLEAVPWKSLRSEAAVPAGTFVYPLSGYNSPDPFDYTDLAEAERMMNDAREKYGISLEKELPLVFEVSEFTLTEEKKALLVDAFKPLGVNLQIRELPSYVYLRNVPYSDADMFAYTWIGDFADPLAFLELFRSDSSLNDSGWSDAEYDALIEKAAAVADVERYELLSAAEKILLDGGMVLPVYHPVSFNLINLNEVGGWAANAFDVHPLKYLYRKEAKSTIPNVVMKTSGLLH